MVNTNISDHEKRVGYIVYKMMLCEGGYTKKELAEYTILSILHDLGLYKSRDISKMGLLETKSVWAHSIFGYLFLEKLSPIGDKAEVVLYHHLDYNKYALIRSEHMKIIPHLALADKIDVFYRIKNNGMQKDYFEKNRDIEFSGKSYDLFLEAEEKYHFTEKLDSNEYEEEFCNLFNEEVFDEEYKKSLLEMLVYAIDFRSEHTVIHTLATVSFAKALAKLMKLSEGEQYLVYYGALLHDLGKLSTPLEILEAPRKLTAEEMNIMKKHVEVTEEILEGLVNDEVLKIAVRHHEKLDGSGYPRGLTDEQLTVSQKIVAVADIISALYGRRSYKDSFDNKLVKKILKEDAAQNRISSEVVECAVVHYEEILQSFEKEKDKTVGVYLQMKDEFQKIYQRFRQFD